MARERCPKCGSENITGRGFDMGDGDELQERYCYDCEYGEDRMRSKGGVSWYGNKKKRTPATDPAVEQKLLDEVYAALDDDGPRSIYADWLIEHDDPRGTFIALQLARHAKRDPVVSSEEQELLDENWKGWVGAPARVVGKKYVEFERGFWSRCDGFLEVELDDDVLVDRAWSTVRRIALPPLMSRTPQQQRLLAGPLCRSLRSLEIAASPMDQLARIDPPLEHVEEIMLALSRASEPDALPPLPGLPRLRRFGVQCNPESGPRWIELADVARFRDVRLRCASPKLDHLQSILSRAQATRIATLAIEDPYPGSPTYFADRADGTLVLRSVELKPAARGNPDGKVEATKKLLGKLGQLVAPGVTIEMQKQGFAARPR